MLSKLSHGVTTVMVTGTNGKTTTCRMLEQMLRDAGRDCFANRSGSNLERGIAADFAANASLFGRPKRRCAVIECDEAAFRRVCGEIKPAVAVVTNVFGTSWTATARSRTPSPAYVRACAAPPQLRSA